MTWFLDLCWLVLPFFCRLLNIETLAVAPTGARRCYKALVLQTRSAARMAGRGRGRGGGLSFNTEVGLDQFWVVGIRMDLMN